jgi:lipopolysaccharide/colanic/teichoic acid biosynthesis glycosyltransferase
MNVTRPSRIETPAHAPTGPAVEYRELGGLAYWLKGVLDRIGALIAIVILAVPFVLIAAAVKLTSPGPVFIRQTRVGRYGRPFEFWKFRSMRPDAEHARDELEEDNEHDSPLIFKMRLDPRVTPFGRFMRRTSIDELPNLFNVLRGEMSLVGPRPPLPREVSHYSAYHMQRLAATPGITGLWQVRGRSEIPFEEMVKIDLEYIETWSLWLDVKIMLRTPLTVLGGRGAW